MKRRLIALGAAGLGAVMALWLACGGSRRVDHPAPASDDPSAAGRVAARRDPSAAPSPAANAAPQPARAPASAAASAALVPNADAGAGARQAQGAELWRQIETASRQDLSLLSSLERELGHVPPEAHELIRRRNTGASVAELRAWLRQHGPKELRARLLLSRWLSEIAGDGGATVDPAPLAGTDGGVPKLLGTLRKKDAAP